MRSSHGARLGDDRETMSDAERVAQGQVGKDPLASEPAG